MCGIFCLLNDKGIQPDFVETQFQKGKNRGPESSKLLTYDPSIQLGFHRLAINGLNDESNQPLQIEDMTLICNGEIYNYRYLYNLMNIVPNTDSDCEVIIHLYLRYGIEQTLQMLDGVFAFILHDTRLNQIFVARDPFGVRPLYQLSNLLHFSNLFGFASNLNCLVDFVALDEYHSLHYIDSHKGEQKKDNEFIHHFRPGTFSVYTNNEENGNWVVQREHVPYFIPSPSSSVISLQWLHWESYLEGIREHLLNAVAKRCVTTERPVACLLSGGLDSSLIAALVHDYYHYQRSDSRNSKKPPFQLETFSIGLEGSVDLEYARIVAKYLDSKHHEIIVTEKEMFDAIPEVIHAIETFDTTSVRASIGNYLLGKYIKEHSDAKVIFNGDGSDELCGGYLYMSKCEDTIEFDKETRRLLQDIHKFDVLRSDKSISSHGLEPRTPFLDKAFVNYYLSIPPYARQHTNFNKMEKFLLRSSFAKDVFENEYGQQILPDSILWRRKEAFSDGVAGQNKKPLYAILQTLIGSSLNMTPCIETEKYYYLYLFNLVYAKAGNLVPYFWMPKYTDATDPSARTLTIYQELKAKTEKEN